MLDHFDINNLRIADLRLVNNCSQSFKLILDKDLSSFKNNYEFLNYLYLR